MAKSQQYFNAYARDLIIAISIKILGLIIIWMICFNPSQNKKLDHLVLAKHFLSESLSKD
ncbi:MAG: hypothetical protein A3F12_06195 [Gammaproteobacteria bacterium RIFCSPHIGHO2_12_FULL_38_14]|nr:MAG: hypothetical protein A3F12_06195 [Gammaproteobacteria bacterium RIFCSPHIGHO2_12_FULL_38_14]